MTLVNKKQKRKGWIFEYKFFVLEKNIAWKTEILGFETRNTAQGIRNWILISSIQILLTKTGIQYMDTVLDPLLIYMEREYASFR